MPPPKIFTQQNRTDTILADMERKQIPPMRFAADGSVPVMIAEGFNVPPWLAVRANRLFFRHASFQLIMLVAKLYKPPPGRRLIIDMLDMNATSPATLEDWMRSDLIELDDFAKDKVERTRAALKQLSRGDQQNHHYDDSVNNWRAQIMHVGRELAQAGHIKTIPFCIETDDNGFTYPPFALPNAKNSCGEADVGVLRWMEMMQADRQHITLQAERKKSKPIDPTLAKYYSAQQLATNAELVASRGAQPLSVAERREAAQKAVALNPDALLPGRLEVEHIRAAVAEGLPRLETNPCKEPNRGLILSVDTDFLSLSPLFYARLVFAKQDEQYCYDNAPLLSIGECNVMRTGWLTSGADFYKATAKKRKYGGGGGSDDDDNDGDDVASDDDQAAARAVDAVNQANAILAHEVYDIHVFYKLLLKAAGCENGTPQQRLDAILSFAFFCAACKNDYMKGNYGINRKHQFEAFLAVKCRLVTYHTALGLPIVLPTQYQSYVKHCYYVSIKAKRGGDKWLPREARTMHNAEMKTITERKYKGTGERSVSSRMPDAERRQLMLDRLQWWIVYAFCSWQDIGPVLDHSVWGWKASTTHLMV